MLVSPHSALAFALTALASPSLAMAQDGNTAASPKPLIEGKGEQAARDTSLRKGSYSISSTTQFIRSTYVVSESDDAEGSSQSTELLENDSWTTNFFLPEFTMGLTERWHLSFTAPGVAYRLGDRESSEWLPYLQMPIELRFTSYGGFGVGLSPKIGLDTRHWIFPDLAIAWGLKASSYFFRDSEFSSVFESYNGRVYVGIVVHLGEQFTLNLKVDGYANIIPDSQDSFRPGISYLGAISKGVWSSPVLRWDALSWFSVGATGGGFQSFETRNRSWNVGGTGMFLW